VAVQGDVDATGSGEAGSAGVRLVLAIWAAAWTVPVGVATGGVVVVAGGVETVHTGPGATGFNTVTWAGARAVPVEDATRGGVWVGGLEGARTGVVPRAGELLEAWGGSGLAEMLAATVGVGATSMPTWRRTWATT
jgi:hypothetical protein